MKSLLFAAAFVYMFAAMAMAQPRPMDKSVPPKPAAAAASQAPTSVPAKYEGGMYGYSRKLSGTLKFDDENTRLVFFGEDNKELFHIPYDALLVIYPQSKSVTSKTGNVVSHIPLSGAGLAGLIKEKRRYLIAQFQDPDVNVSGVVNFKLENKETLDSVMRTLAAKAGLEPRGDAFYRPKARKDS